MRLSFTDILAKTVASSIVSNLDYCNSILVGTLKANLHMLQLAQNTVACIITWTKWYACIQPGLSMLNCLLVYFEKAMLTFKIRQSGRSAYVAILIHDKSKTRSLRCSNKCYLKVPRWPTETTKLSFSCAAPSMWNSLPDVIWQLDLDISTFIKQLKTYFFQLAYP